jgi:alginate O-acetyltransferase complex protein AlgI
MVFTSVNFLLFFPVLIMVYYIIPSKYRWMFLLAASYFFYINIKPVFVLLLAGVTLSTYLFGRLIEQTPDEAKKKGYMIINVVLILLPLFFFKYFAFINNSIFAILGSYKIRWPLPEIKLLLPIGISFYTFMAIGYTVDVYNEKIEAEKNLGILALFISFFPLILSGPIERATNMLPQFKSQIKFDYTILLSGFKMMLWGYFMKLVVADRLGIFIDTIYSTVPYQNGTTLFIASILYPFQVYADFGGYSLIAIGVAKSLGINVMQNFRRPFFATSMSELWRRWHISLISWLTDYVFTPLSFTFRKYKVWGIVISLMITFFISGIWHSAALTFVVWGLIQGVYLSIEALTNPQRSAFEKKYNLNSKTWYFILGCLITFILFTASLVFERAASLNEAFLVFRRIFTTRGPIFIEDYEHLIYGVTGIIFILIIEISQEFFKESQVPFSSRYWVVEQIAYILLIVAILAIGVFDGGQFIYFKY